MARYSEGTAPIDRRIYERRKTIDHCRRTQSAPEGRAEGRFRKTIDTKERILLQLTTNIYTLHRWQHKVVKDNSLR
jgi:hypothetical protein